MNANGREAARVATSPARALRGGRVQAAADLQVARRLQEGREGARAEDCGVGHQQSACFPPRTRTVLVDSIIYPDIIRAAAPTGPTCKTSRGISRGAHPFPAAHVAAITLDRLPTEVIAKAKLCIVLDTLGCCPSPGRRIRSSSRWWRRCGPPSSTTERARRCGPGGAYGSAAGGARERQRRHVVNADDAHKESMGPPACVVIPGRPRGRGDRERLGRGGAGSGGGGLTRP
jgi:hypothetical protein